MKNILLIATTLFSIFTFAQVDPIISIPDANFKAKLLEASPSNQIASSQTPNGNGSVSTYHKIDINNDGEIQVSEALSITYLNVTCQYCSSTQKISSLEGILSFINLQLLSCSFNQLTNLNVQGLINLKTLHCSYNNLNSLNVQGLINLRTLGCSDNQLTTLNAQGLTYLNFLSCSYNLLANINIQGLINIQTLHCDYNQLTTLNLQGLYLSELRCNNNPLTSLLIKNGISNIVNYNFSGNPNLQYICCSDNQLAQVQQKVISNGQTNCQVNTYCSFPPGGNYNTISGQVKYDFENNGCDANDLPIMFAKITSPSSIGNNTIYANNQGQYNAYVLQGTHTITPQIENPSFFVTTPPSAQVTFSNNNYNTQTQNFCITPNGIHHDVEVTLIPITPARPGFDATYKIIYKNKGNQVENGSIIFSMYNPNVVDFVSCSPTYNSQTTNASLETFTWNYSNLQPFETREINIVTNLNSPMETPPLNAGAFLSYDAQILINNSDENTFDNFSGIRQLVVNSYDPNDKTCIEGATITPAMVGEYVHYVIRFENTGTYPAENVVIKDMIDLTKFDIATLLPIKASHNFETRIAGNKVEFIFENINLPFDDANNDGYVAFKIKTKPTLVLGDTFSNQANIYFDYNFPIITNTATTTVAALSSTDFDFGTHFTLYPNPVKDILHFQSKDGISIHSIEIYTTLGQVVLAVTDTLSTVDVSSLQAGNYIVKVRTDLGVSNTKFIKE